MSVTITATLSSATAAPADIRVVKSALNRLGLYRPDPAMGIVAFTDAALFEGIRAFQQQKKFLIIKGDFTWIRVIGPKEQSLIMADGANDREIKINNMTALIIDTLEINPNGVTTLLLGEIFKKQGYQPISVRGQLAPLRKRMEDVFGVDLISEETDPEGSGKRGGRLKTFIYRRNLTPSS